MNGSHQLFHRNGTAAIRFARRLVGGFALLAASPFVQADPLVIPEAMRAQLALRTEALQPVTAVARASGLATIAAGPNADSRTVVSAPVDGTISPALPTAGQSVSPGTVLAYLESPQLAALRASAQTAAAQLRQAEQIAARDQKLLAEGLIATKRWQASESDLASARAADRAAQAQLQLMGDATHRDGTRLSITAPVAGIIDQWLVQPGTRVTQGTPVLTLSTAEQWWLLALPSEQLPAQMAGAVLRINGCTGAPLRAIDATVDADSQLVTIRAKPHHACASLRPGQRITAALWTPVTESTYAIPVAALSTHEGRWQVFVQRGANYFAIPVVEVAATTGVVFVQGAFQPDDALIVSGANLLKAISLGMGTE